MTADPDSALAADLAALQEAIADANDRASFNVLLDLAHACRLAEQVERMQAVVDAAIAYRDDASGELFRQNALWDALDALPTSEGR